MPSPCRFWSSSKQLNSRRIGVGVKFRHAASLISLETSRRPRSESGTSAYNPYIPDKPIRIFNHSEMWRDFTYIDDIVDGVPRALDRPPSATPPHAIYKLGNPKSEKLTDFIAELEKAMGKKAEEIMEPIQPGDVAATCGEIN